MQWYTSTSSLYSLLNSKSPMRAERTEMDEMFFSETNRLAESKRWTMNPCAGSWLLGNFQLT